MMFVAHAPMLQLSNFPHFGPSGWGKCRIRRDVPVGVPLDLSTPTGMGVLGHMAKIASQVMCQNIVFY